VSPTVTIYYIINGIQSTHIIKKQRIKDEGENSVVGEEREGTGRIEKDKTITAKIYDK
jgi:hypothetical protein